MGTSSLLRGMVLVGALALVGCGETGEKQKSPPGLSVSRPAVVGCSANNNVTLSCDELNGYVASCGVICPITGERKLDHGGCTEFLINEGPAIAISESWAKVGKEHCVDVNVNWHWTFTRPPESVTLKPTINNACCAHTCNAEVGEVLGALDEHEKGHRDIVNGLVDAINTQWASRPFRGCSKQKKDAKADMDAQVAAAAKKTRDDFNRDSKVEPAQPRSISCSEKCRPAGANESCVTGVCMSEVLCYDAPCPLDYYCWGVFEGIHPVCCKNEPEFTCACPQGYVTCAGLCWKGSCP